LRRLAQLGFVELLEGEKLRLPPSLMRFAEPVRGLGAPSEALKKLIESGEVSLGPGDSEPDADEAELAPDAADDADLAPESDAVDAEAAAELGPADAVEHASTADPGIDLESLWDTLPGEEA
jgi:chromosome condensin MukBEF MukE localization factor